MAPYLTLENHAALLAPARFRTKREIEHLVAEIAPRPDVPARIEPLGPRPVAANLWQAFTASLRGPVRELEGGVGAGEAPPVVGVDSHEGAGDGGASESSAPVRVEIQPPAASNSLRAPRYRVEFTASEQYVELLEEARDLLQHQVPDRDVARIHELAMAAFVEQLRKRRHAASGRQGRADESIGSAPARVNVARSDEVGPAWVEAERSAPARMTAAREGSAPERVRAAREGSAPERVRGCYVPAEIRREVWRRDAGCCTFADSNGRRCRERAGLEIHHEHALALGGPTTLENLRLLCRAHNALFAERDFGRAHIERLRTAGRDGERAG